MLTSAIVKLMSVLSLMLSPLYSEPWPFQQPNFWIGIIVFAFGGLLVLIYILTGKLHKKNATIDTAADLEAAALRAQEGKTAALNVPASPDMQSDAIEMTLLKPLEHISVTPAIDDEVIVASPDSQPEVSEVETDRI